MRSLIILVAARTSVEVSSVSVGHRLWLAACWLRVVLGLARQAACRLQVAGDPAASAVAARTVRQARVPRAAAEDPAPDDLGLEPGLRRGELAATSRHLPCYC